jgi:aquaporin Z
MAECIGTFALVFCGTGAIIIHQITGGGVGHLGIALTFGLTVATMIYAFGDISGAHFNPAVTFGFSLSGTFPKRDILPYVASQIAGGLLASLLLKALFAESTGLGATTPLGSSWQSFVLEVILTFFLMLVIFQVSSGSKEKGIMAGLAIGGVVAMEAAFAGPISGASMNPARSIAPALVSGQLQHLWIYLLAPLAGASAAVPFHKLFKNPV